MRKCIFKYRKGFYVCFGVVRLCRAAKRRQMLVYLHGVVVMDGKRKKAKLFSPPRLRLLGKACLQGEVGVFILYVRQRNTHNLTDAFLHIKELNAPSVWNLL